MGNRLKELRESQNLTAGYVSTELGMNRNMVAAYERGERTPSLKTLVKLAQFYNTTTDYILGLTDNKWTQKKR
ncbi:XRE family transcriptional regulator [Weissella viridescens]|uniref:XRE family transcriptional regulator n=1 Tax=Weissella viridescens TaxID=1629 RepID=A0A3P2RC55_WEIVI|nr:helix-turn-helix transcriptional regulator [Weissella viridescens]RRG18237.1 XRE family transcriptional regulator [Weissella viridescens]